MSFKRVRDISIIRKLTLAYFVFIFLPSVIVSGYSYYQLKKSGLNEVLNSGKTYVSQIEHNINSKCSVIESIGNNITYNVRLHNFLKDNFTMNKDSYAEYSEYIYPLVNYAMVFQKVNISKIKIFMHNKSIPEGWDIFFQESRVDYNDWYKKFKQESHNSKWIGPHNANYFNYLKSEEKRPTMTYLEKIQSMDGTFLGIAAIDIVTDDLFSFVDDIYRQNEFICITDMNGTILYSWGKDKNDRSWIEKWKKTESYGVYEGTFIHEGNMHVYKHIKPLNICIFTAVPIDPRFKAFKAVSRNMALLTVLNALLILVFYLVLRYIFIRITKNIKTVNDIIGNNFTGKLPVDRKDEIGQIAQQFNRLINRVNELVCDVVKKETAQRDAQLKALQFQINPHFIYNTIDIFRAKLEIEGNYEVADSMAYFGKILRYNIETKSLYTTLEFEVKYAMQYISIHKLKYGDRLNVNVNLPEYIKKHRIIKFILQPIIENSITHGFKGRDCKIFIDIGFEVRKDRIWVDIIDNGTGFNRRVMDQMNYQLKYSKYDSRYIDSGDSIGLRNINERLKLFYGSSYYLQLYSEAGEYTKAFFSIPFEGDSVKGQGEEYDNSCYSR